MHAELFPAEARTQFDFEIAGRSIHATSYREGTSYFAEMDQGVATVNAPIPPAKHEVFLKALNLSIADLAADLPLQVISTGLPYLIVPIGSNLEGARITVTGFEALLATISRRVCN